MSYSAVMLLAKERPKLLPLVVSAHRIAVQFGDQFSGRSVVSSTPGMPQNQSLLPLARRGIVVKVHETKQGHRAIYRLADPPGVERALRELGLISEVDALSGSRS